MRTLVILGGGTAGTMAANKLRARLAAEEWQIIVIDKDDNHDYQPAYRHSVETYNRNPNRSFDEVEPELSRDWSRARGKSSLEWGDAKPAARDAWDRVSNAAERVIPGDSDKDGR